MNEKAAAKLERIFNNALIIIEKWDIKGTTIGTWLGIGRSSVSAKLKGTDYERFTNAQKEIIVLKLQELRKDLARL